jgi:flagellar hook assembly protein FlgD
MTIRFNLPSSERASAEVFDLEGKRVRRLATDREFPAGTQALGWDGRNDAGVGLPSGVYFVKVRVGTHSEARRAVLLH